MKWNEITSQSRSGLERKKRLIVWTNNKKEIEKNEITINFVISSWAINYVVVTPIIFVPKHYMNLNGTSKLSQ